MAFDINALNKIKADKKNDLQQKLNSIEEPMKQIKSKCISNIQSEQFEDKLQQFLEEILENEYDPRNDDMTIPYYFKYGVYLEQEYSYDDGNEEDYEAYNKFDFDEKVTLETKSHFFMKLRISDSYILFDLEVYYENEVGSKLLNILKDKRIMDNYAIDVIDAFTEKLHELKIKYISRNNSEDDMKYDNKNQQIIFYMTGNIFL